MRAFSGRVARMIAAVGLVAACGTSGTAGQGGVTILVSWSGNNLDVFRNDVIDPFEKSMNINVTVESTRGLAQELDVDRQQGSLPDLAALPSIGAVEGYARQGKLKPLERLVDPSAYGSPWSQLMKAGSSDHVYAVPVKVDVKSLIWYNPAVLRGGVPATWQGVIALDKTIEAHGGTPWCLALSSASTSGWPGTDWIADILLSEYGPMTYQQWVDGHLPWTSGPVAHAWQLWGQIVGDGKAIYGGSRGALLTSVGDVTIAKRASSSGCDLAHGTLVDEGFPSGWKFGTDYDFAPFPAVGAGTSNAIQVSADFVGMFNSTPQAESLIRYLGSATAQNRWVSIKDADGFSANRNVPVKEYPDPVTRDIASLLTGGHTLCFGASDAMSPDLSAAFYQAVLDYLQDPKALPMILGEMAKVPLKAGPPVCGTP
jgi:alpha-glucoside transport system substrate-binding protein